MHASEGGAHPVRRGNWPSRCSPPGDHRRQGLGLRCRCAVRHGDGLRCLCAVRHGLGLRCRCCAVRQGDGVRRRSGGGLPLPPRRRPRAAPGPEEPPPRLDSRRATGASGEGERVRDREE